MYFESLWHKFTEVMLPLVIGFGIGSAMTTYVFTNYINQYCPYGL